MISLNHFHTSAARLFTVGMLLASAGSALAEVHYVDVNSTTATPPYTNWITAATNIQDAVDAAVAGDEIVVTNGTYASGGRATTGDSTPNRVAVDKPISVRSVNGPQVTIIDGGQTNRCVYLVASASLSGLTLTNGFAWHGAGVWCGSATAVVSNCLVSGNSGPDAVFPRDFDAPSGGGVYGGTINHCVLSDNRVLGSAVDTGWGAGGGACKAILNYCTLRSNLALFGGGAGDCDLRNCTLIANSGRFGAGGAIGCTLNDCIVNGNAGAWGGGAYGGTLNNCLVTGNSASYGGGAWAGTLNNCTIMGNSATNSGGGASGSKLNNCIVYFNTVGGLEWNYADAGRDALGSDTGEPAPPILNYCCTTPMPGSGVGNITNAPMFVDTNGWANLRLQSISPCINAGNNAYAVGNTDLDGNPRISGGIVDMGAYEFQWPPQLTITRSGAYVFLTWPTNSIGWYILQSTMNLASTVGWCTVSTPVDVVNGQYMATPQPIVGAQQYYRLLLVGPGPCSEDCQCPCGQICVKGVCTQYTDCR